MSTIISVNVGTPQVVEFRGHTVSTGIYKSPVKGPVRVEGVNLTGDRQADLRVHGGIHKAVYAYASEDYEWWSWQLDRTLVPGTFGDNLTTEGINLGMQSSASAGGSTTQFSRSANPGCPATSWASAWMTRTSPPSSRPPIRPGSYLRIIEEGSLAAGDGIEVGPPPSHGLTVADIARIYDRDQHEAGRLLEAADLSEPWKRWARRLATT